MATHSSIPAWEIPWTEKPGGLQSMWSQKSWTRSRTAHREQAREDRKYETSLWLWELWISVLVSSMRGHSEKSREVEASARSGLSDATKTSHFPPFLLNQHSNQNWGQTESCSCPSSVQLLSCVQLSATPWTVAYQALPSMGFSRQEYWSELSHPSPGDLPDPGI